MSKNEINYFHKINELEVLIEQEEKEEIKDRLESIRHEYVDKINSILAAS